MNWRTFLTLAFLYCLASLNAAPAANLLALRPGETTRGKAPETWSLDLRGLNQTEAQAAATKLSQRLYGQGEPELHHPLVIKTDFPKPKIFGLHLSAVSLAGGDLRLQTNGVTMHERSWPKAPSTHRINNILYVPLPAGAVEISLQANRGGPVVIDQYFLADAVEDLPRHLPRIQFTAATQPVERVPITGDVSRPDDGYRGIWFTLGQFSEHGDKYSGGLGTYTANHIPLAIYAPAVNKTFFVYGGTIKDQRHLLIMASYYDHARNVVPRPTIVHDKRGVDDPHDNPSLCLDDRGHLWVFISGRGRSRPGVIYRSKKPYDVSDFEFILQDEFTYPQPRYFPGQGFFHLLTKYTRGRELYWATSPDGKTWSEAQKLAGIRGHYQVSNVHGNKIATFFNRHPDGSVDRRTDLYYAQTTDFGKTWTTVDGRKLELPLSEPDNAARVIDYESKGRLQYTVDLNFDQHGNPILLYVTSAGYKPGPENDPREWTLTRWNGRAWETHVVTRSDHNYDLGSLYITDQEWLIIGPTEKGPQPYGTGGEMALWFSTDEGKTWTKRKQITERSEFNHAYARRPVDARDPFYVFWADGNPDQQSVSRLYFGNSTGDYWQLPYDMEGEFATPVEVKR